MTFGRFIAFEGGEGAGKSTQTKLLAEALAKRGIDVVTTREPGGTPGSEAIRQLLLDPLGEAWNSRAEALLFAAARSQHVSSLIRPSLQAGRWVICDRYLDSSRAYQGGGSGLTDDDILALHQIGSEGLLPDVTILIEVSSTTAAARAAHRDGGQNDRIGGREATYHARVAKAFDEYAANAPDRFLRIDGNGSADETHQNILQAITPLLDVS